MAYDFFGLGPSDSSNTIQVEGGAVELPDASYIRDAAMIRDGADLVLDGPQGTVTVEGYFSAAETPDLTAPGGLVLSPELVESFARSPAQFAQNSSLTDESPVGAVDEVSGEATITRLDGTVEPIAQGTSVYQGDVIETNADGAVNISFIDETSFAVSEDARLAIDEYVFDPSTDAGTQNFSVLKGVFVFTSGLIGRDDPDDVSIDTPSGSIGIRGTIIAGNVDTGEITVVEGAIVLRDHNGNEMTLATQFETAKMDNAAGEIHNMGRMAAQEVADRFVNVSDVSPTLFSSINDAMAEQAPDAIEAVNQPKEGGPADGPHEQFDADGTVDHNNDAKVDGTIDESTGDQGEQDGGKGLPPTGEGPNGEEALDGPLDPTGEAKPLGPHPTGTMGTDPMGTNMGGLNPPPAPGTQPQGADTNTAATAGAGGTGPNSGPNHPPPPPPPEETNANNPPPPPPTGGVADNAPIHIGSTYGPDQDSIAPDAFFAMSDNQTFSYHFDLEFFNTDMGAGDVLTYQLSGQTIFNLDNSEIAGNWTFDDTNGLLTINTTTLTADNTFNIEILAHDIAGNVNLGNFQDYTFNLVQATNPVTGGGAISIDAPQTTNVYSGDGVQNNFTLGGGSPATDVEIFAGDGNDIVTISNGSNNNYINLGNDANQITISGPSTTDNEIVGGFDIDTVQLNNVYNKVHTMDGDDFIKINLTSGSAQADLMATIPATTIFMDGGHDNLLSLPAVMPDGRGDTLSLEGSAVNLDFRLVDDTYIRGIERLDLKNTSGGSTVKLSLSDVIEMTDHNNTLIIRRDGDDMLDLFGFGSFQKIQENEMLDDDAGGLTMTNFDVYSDGNVTLLVEDPSLATGVPLNVTGLPG